LFILIDRGLFWETREIDISFTVDDDFKSYTFCILCSY